MLAHLGFTTILTITICSVPTYVFPQTDEGVYVRSGFLSGNDWHAIGLAEQTGYAMGIVEGIILGAAFGDSGSSLSWVQDCVTAMKANQLRAIINNEVNNSPGDWHKKVLNTTALKSLFDVCPNSPKNQPSSK